MHIMTLWLISGVVLVAIEAFGAPGIGMMFAGLGAITAGAAIWLNLVGMEDMVAQWVIFFISTAAWAALLWAPLQKFRRPSPGYSNIVGETAFVGSNGLTKSKGGEVTWSGTIMKAQLAKDVHVDHLEAGSQVTILEVKGATLLVKPKD